MSTPPRTHEAVIQRVFPHPVARVYRAWTQPEHIARWLRPSVDIRLEVREFDLRVGGEYWFHYTFDDRVFPVRGKFLTIEPERALIFTWMPQEPDIDAGKDTMVSVWFRSRTPQATEVELRHTLFPDENMRQRHENGWLGSFDMLSRHLPDKTET